MIFAERSGKWKGARAATFCRMIPVWVLGLVLAFLASPALAQTPTGSETTVNITSGQANLGTNLPAQNYSLTTGLNTFITPSVPTNAAVRIQITNETSNICSGAFQVTVWTTLERQVSSFNNNLQVWQLVPLISPATGAYVGNSGLLTLGGLQTTLLTSAAIAGNTTAIQVVNTTGGCGTTNIDVVATFITTAITSPLVSVASNGLFQLAGNASQVQGIIAQQVNGQLVNPVILGGLQLPTNGTFTSVGIDTFNSGSELTSTGGACTAASQCTSSFVGPLVSKPGEFGIAFESLLGSTGGAANPSCPASASSCVLPPWTATSGPASNCAGTSPEGCIAFLANIGSNQVLSQALGQAGNSGVNTAAVIVSSSSATSVRQSNTSSTAAVAFTSNTLAGSTLVAALGCSGTTPCTVTTVTDTQGLTWKPLTAASQLLPGFQSSGLIVWAAITTSSASADTITFTVGSGTALNSMAVELTGTSPSQLVTPSISGQFDPIGRAIEAADAQAPNQFNCNVTLSTNTTTQCQGAPGTINGVAVRLYVTDFQINTTTAGTADLIQLKTGTGTNCGTGTANLSAITYNNTAVGLISILGTRTPLVAPLQSAVCATQTGTAAATVTIEIRGFLAP